MIILETVQGFKNTQKNSAIQGKISCLFPQFQLFIDWFAFLPTVLCNEDASKFNPELQRFNRKKIGKNSLCLLFIIAKAKVIFKVLRS